MVLSLDRLTKTFGSKIAVDNLSIDMKPGVYGLVGSNGAGKTTLMRMICAILEPSSGEVLLNGKNVVDMGAEYRDLLGYLPQDFGYYPHYTAKDYLIYIGVLKGISRREAMRKSKQLLEMVGLSDVANKKIRTFSGGMKQRLGIAQALLNDPKILILDEPTSGLDPKERVRFRNLLSSFASNRIVLLSTHIVTDVEAIADRVYVMKNGRIVSQGSIHELLDEVKGHVWEMAVDPAEVENWEACATVANLRREDNRTILRIVSEDPPSGSAASVPATLEDLYLYHFPTERS
ncbi:MAG: ABC transporter ATP-binding protein [Lachnospiraceae bacterium]|nr:ABC transporter ATP-binding protein [Lachnospiraceae bacterium]